MNSDVRVPPRDEASCSIFVQMPKLLQDPEAYLGWNIPAELLRPALSSCLDIWIGPTRSHAWITHPPANTATLPWTLSASRRRLLQPRACFNLALASPTRTQDQLRPVAHPRANGQVKRINGLIIEGLNKRIFDSTIKKGDK
jgi:hypothetical protein